MHMTEAVPAAPVFFVMLHPLHILPAYKPMPPFKLNIVPLLIIQIRHLIAYTDLHPLLQRRKADNRILRPGPYPDIQSGSCDTSSPYHILIQHPPAGSGRSLAPGRSAGFPGWRPSYWKCQQVPPPSRPGSRCKPPKLLQLSACVPSFRYFMNVHRFNRLARLQQVYLRKVPEQEMEQL